MKLGVLYSSGKDSNYALYLMQKQGHEIKCLITIKSKNPDSFMFHTPNIEMTKLQAESMNIPLVEQVTDGEEGHELKDLERALKRAKEEYLIEGIVTGALFSDYQRTRIENVCKKLNLQVFSPLWHKDQETELREIVNEGFEVVISSVAAEGFDKKWLGLRIDNKMIDNLKKLHEQKGINPAGEGGEYESLVLDAPMFKKKIKIMASEIAEEGKNTAKMLVKKSELTKK